jgi:hypothetical protein
MTFTEKDTRMIKAKQIGGSKAYVLLPKSKEREAGDGVR